MGKRREWFLSVKSFPMCRGGLRSLFDNSSNVMFIPLVPSVFDTMNPFDPVLRTRDIEVSGGDWCL